SSWRRCSSGPALPAAVSSCSDSTGPAARITCSICTTSICSGTVLAYAPRQPPAAVALPEIECRGSTVSEVPSLSDGRGFQWCKLAHDLAGAPQTVDCGADNPAGVSRSLAHRQQPPETGRLPRVAVAGDADRRGPPHLGADQRCVLEKRSPHLLVHQRQTRV